MKADVKRKLWWGTGGLVAAGVLIGGLVWAPWYFEGDHVRDGDLAPAAGVIITGFRTMVIAVIAGAIAALGLWYTHRNHQLARRQFEHTQEQFAKQHAQTLEQFRLAQRQFDHAQEQFRHTQAKDREQAELTRESQVTDRYVEAIKLLGSDNLYERLGGVYSLERIMQDSEKDHATVLRVLAAFIRRRAEIPTAGGHGGSAEDVPGDDVQAAVQAIGHRVRSARPPVRIDLSRANLSGCDLEACDLSGMDLSHCDLRNARLVAAALRGTALRCVRLGGAKLDEADLTGADLSNADLRNVALIKVSLERGVLRGADLSDSTLLEVDLRDIDATDTNLARARLSSSRLSGASMIGTNLRGADLAEAQSLESYHFDRALLDGTTQLPAGLKADPSVRSRIARCEARFAKEP